MYTLTIEEAQKKWPVSPALQNHHFTGPPEGHQPECHGSVFHHEGVILAGLAYMYGGPILELGTDLGISTRYLHEGLVLRQKDMPESVPPKIYAVDIYHKCDLSRYTKDIEQIHASSWDYQCPVLVPLAWIDADHQKSAVLKDIGTALRAGAPVIAFHDTSPTMPPAVSASQGSNARDAVLEAFDEEEWDLYDVQTRCGIMVAVAKDLEESL